MFDIFKKPSEEHNNGELNTAEPCENTENDYLPTLEALDGEEKSLLTEKSQLLNMEETLRQKIRGEIEAKKHRIVLAAHQPNYLPYIGFFHKAMMCDVFVIADHVQYTKKQWQNRNKIRTKSGWIWLTVPVISKNHFEQRINEVKIDNSVNWADTHWKSIFYNYLKAPFFGSYKAFFKEVYSKKWEKLLDLNETIIYRIFKELNIKAKVVKSSTLNLEGSKTNLLVEMCKKLNADTYLSGNGAKTYMQKETFKNENIKLLFQDFHHPVYPQRFNSFLPNISIIDLLFNVGSDKARELISKSSDTQ